MMNYRWDYETEGCNNNAAAAAACAIKTGILHVFAVYLIVSISGCVFVGLVGVVVLLREKLNAWLTMNSSITIRVNQTIIIVLLLLWRGTRGWTFVTLIPHCFVSKQSRNCWVIYMHVHNDTIVDAKEQMIICGCYMAFDLLKGSYKVENSMERWSFEFLNKGLKVSIKMQ